MPVSVNHHVGLRVSDIDRAARFYIDAFGARYQTSPMLYAGPDAELIMGGTAGARFKVCHLGFDDGTIELFEFLEPAHPTGGLPDPTGQIMHFAIEVDDVPAALNRVEAAGGTRYWPEVRDMPGFQVVYVTDPDGNVLELADIPIAGLIAAIIADDPSNGPPA